MIWGFILRNHPYDALWILYNVYHCTCRQTQRRCVDRNMLYYGNIGEAQNQIQGTGMGSISGRFNFEVYIGFQHIIFGVSMMCPKNIRYWVIDGLLCEMWSGGLIPHIIIVACYYIMCHYIQFYLCWTFLVPPDCIGDELNNAGAPTKLQMLMVLKHHQTMP